MNDEGKFESVDEAEAHIVQRLSARATHLLAAARASCDPETQHQIALAEQKGAHLVAVADGKGKVSVVLLAGWQIVASLYEVDGEGHSVVRALHSAN